MNHVCKEPRKPGTGKPQNKTTDNTTIKAAKECEIVHRTDQFFLRDSLVVQKCKLYSGFMLALEAPLRVFLMYVTSNELHNLSDCSETTHLRLHMIRETSTDLIPLGPFGRDDESVICRIEAAG